MEAFDADTTDAVNPNARASGAAPSNADGRPRNSSRGSYVDFEIEIGPGQGHTYPVAVIRSPAGEARSTMRFPYDEIALDNRLRDLQVALLRSGGVRRQVLTPEEAGVQEFGQSLFDALLDGECRSRFDVSAREARRRGQGLRLKLRIRPPELARLPWEYLYDSRVGEYVCLSRDTPVVRFLEIPHAVEPLRVTPPLRVLAMVVSPKNLPALETARERQRIERALAPLQRNGLAELHWLSGGTWRDLQRAMRGGPWHVFHFVGHGGFDTNAQEGVVALVDEKGNSHQLLATEVGRLLADHHSLRLVVINSCLGARSTTEDVFSSTAAVLVRRGLPAVLAMQDEITDRAAIEFSRAFYEALAEGLPVDASVSEARKAVSLAVTNTMEWGTPVLYMRTHDGVIFDIPPTSRRPTPEPSIRPEDDAVLEHAYTEALSAFWVGDWDQAINRFRSIVENQPDYADAASRLSEAEQRRGWQLLDEQARTAEQAGDPGEATALLQELTEQAPDYLDVEERLVALRKQIRLDGLLAEAARLSDAEQWRAVLAVFDEIREVEPDYDDPGGLLTKAEAGAEELERMERLDDLYGQAVRLVDAGSWAEARERLSSIDQDDPQFRETARLLARCDDELAAAAEAERRARQSVALYEEAAALAQAGQWGESVRRLDELAEIEPHHADPERLREQAEVGVEIEEELARTQKEAAATYAKAVEALNAERYQEALDRWNQVTDLDPDFKDRRSVSATAQRKLAPSELRRTRPRVPWIAAAAVAAVAVLAAVWYATAGGDGVPSVYEDFDDADVWYDREVWQAYPESAEIGWQFESGEPDGALVIREDTTDGQTGLALIDYQFDPSRSMFIEARLRLDPQAANGNVMIGLCCEPVDVNCGVDANGVFCFFQDHSGRDSPRETALERDPTVWHVARAEFDAPLRRFSFMIDDALVGSATPSEEVLAETTSSIVLRVHNHVGPGTIGYIDYVRIGPLED